MARTRISDQIAMSLKDHVRSVQFQLRRRARTPSSVESEMKLIPRQVAMAADAILTQFQSAAGILPESSRQSNNFIFPASISAYFASQSAEIRDFTPELYYAIKALVNRFSAGDCFVSEASVEEAHDRMIQRHNAAITGALAGESGAVTSACGALAAELASLRPIRAWLWEPNQVAAPRHFYLAPNQYVAFVVGLSIAVKSRAEARQVDPSLRDDDIVDLVDLAVDARFTELSAALTSRNPVEYLTKVFAEMLPFIA